MIKKWDLVPSPCDRDINRFKLLLSSTDDSLADVIKYFGQDAGKPFTPLSQEYNFAIYIYNVSEEKKIATEKFLKSKCESGKVGGTSKGKDLEEILEKIAGIEEPELEQPVIKHEDIKKTEKAAEKVAEKAVERVTEKAVEKAAEKVVEKTAEKATENTIGKMAEKTFIEKEVSKGGGWKPKLNLKYVFDEFIVGSNNRFVHAAAWGVSQSPGKTYNPLFIYGGVGLGKTHIMQAIGNTVKDKNPSSKVLYITTEKFTSEVIEAIKTGGLMDFREHYRELDVLLIDDIQFLSEVESTQEEFFHTFNILHENQKQIVMTSDKPPKKLAGIEDRLKSRFEWGLIADIKPPDLETRVAILKRKGQRENLEVDEKILIYIASKLKSNVRELEGFLKRLKAYIEMSNTTLNLELVKELIGDLLPEEEKIEKIEKVEKIIVSSSPAPAVTPAAEAKPAPVVVPEPVIKPAPVVTPEPVIKPAPAVTPAPVIKPAPAVMPEAEPTLPPTATEEKVVNEPVIPVKEEPLPVTPAPVYAAKNEYDLLKPVEVGYFYPEGHENDFEKMKELFKEVIKKHKLKFRLSGVFDKSYTTDKKINYSLFVQLCKTNNLSIIILLGPPPATSVSEDDFTNMITTICETNNISAEIIPYSDLAKQYKYLNVTLDITLLVHKDISRNKQEK
ncbi:MAG: chromosomal replication initiator protein DnaA [Elusimicrobia bacterium]|nr:chromosomal replication initiator protein DnaA [Elusimicrobiota bacterium]